jgi:hypothetical protein
MTKLNKMDERLLEQATKETKLWREIFKLRQNYQFERSEFSRVNSELKKEIRRLNTKELNKKIGNIEHSYGINESVNMYTANSQYEANEKNSETVVYAQHQDNVSEISILESLPNMKHKRRPSSVSSAERVINARRANQNFRDYSPNWDVVSYLEESNISRPYLDDAIQDNPYLNDFQPEKDIVNFSNNMKEISTSYLEDDLEEEHTAKTHRESRNNSKVRQRTDHYYKPSQIWKSSLSTQNLSTIKPSQAKESKISKSKSIKRILPKNTDTLSNVFSQTNLGDNFHINRSDYENGEKDLSVHDYLNQLDRKEKERHTDRYQYIKESSKNYGHKQVKDIIDSQTHNTFDNGEYHDGSFEHNFNIHNSRNSVKKDLNATFDDKLLIDCHFAQQRAFLYHQKNPNISGNKQRDSSAEYVEEHEDEIPHQDHDFDNIEEYDTTATTGQLKKIKSNNNLKSKFERCQKMDQIWYDTTKNYIQHSSREYQPTQRVNSKKKRHQAEPYEKEHPDLKIDSYPTFNKQDVEFLNNSKLPSKIFEKQLRTKSLENNGRNKRNRNRNGNYLQQIPKNRTRQNINDENYYNRKNEQYMTHQMISMHDQIDRESTEKRYKHKPNPQTTIYPTHCSSNYTTSPHLTQEKPKRSSNVAGKPFSRNNHRFDNQVDQGSFDENVPENIMNNRRQVNDKRYDSRNKQKHLQFQGELKQRENKHTSRRTQEADYHEEDDTFTYSIDPESMMASRLNSHN